MNEVEEVKNRIKLSEFVEGYMTLRKSGRNYTGLCPFHKEKTPSFIVSDEKQIYHCFGCNEGGDIYSFYQKIEGVEFKDALMALAERANFTLSTKFNKKDESKTPRLYEINDLASRFFHNAVFTKTGAKALEYLKTRGLDDKTIKEFRLGYAPRSNQLLDGLIKKGYLRSEVDSAGLLRFEGRLIIPINNTNGKTVGFTSRALDDSLPKYINTQETEVYKKSNILYGLDKAKEGIRKEDKVILVEGNMDVITAHKFGFKNVVGTSGTAVSSDQLRLISRYTKNVLLALDRDDAGVNAVLRLLEIAKDSGLNLFVINFEGKDPADALIANDKKFKEATLKPIFAADFVINHFLSSYDPKSPLGKKDLVKKLSNFLYLLGDLVLRAHYLKLIAEKIEIPENVILNAMENKTQKAIPRESVEVIEVKNDSDRNSEYLIVLALTSEKSREYIIKNIESSWLSAPYNSYLNELKSLKEGERSDRLNGLAPLELKADQLKDSKADLLEEAIVAVKKLKKRNLKLIQEDLSKQMKEAQQSNNNTELYRLIEDFQKTLKEQAKI